MFQIDKKHLDKNHSEIFIEMCGRVLKMAREQEAENNNTNSSEESESTVSFSSFSSRF